MLHLKRRTASEPSPPQYLPCRGRFPQGGCGIWPAAALVNHGATPNVTRTFRGEVLASAEMRVRDQPHDLGVAKSCNRDSATCTGSAHVRVLELFGTILRWRWGAGYEYQGVWVNRPPPRWLHASPPRSSCRVGLRYRAIRPIAAGEEVLDGYYDVRLPLATRQERLLRQHGRGAASSVCLNSRGFEFQKVRVVSTRCFGWSLGGAVDDTY